MKRREFLAVAGSSAFTGCVGQDSSGSPTDSTRTTHTTETTREQATTTRITTTERTTTPPVVSTEPSGNITESYVTDDNMEFSTLIGYWLPDVRYFDTKTESVSTVSPEKGGFLQITIQASNLGGSSMSVPRYRGFSVWVNGESFSPKLSLPEGVSFDELRQPDSELPIFEPDPLRKYSNTKIAGGDSENIHLLFFTPEPSGSAFVSLNEFQTDSPDGTVFLEVSI